MTIHRSDTQQEVDGNEKPSTFKRKRTSFQSIGRRSRSFSPGGARKLKTSPELLRQCIDLLASTVLEDCRFQTATPRPTRPPNALHAVVLDVALLVLSGHQHNPKIVHDLGLAFIPAFSTFPPVMHTRLLQFFENGILRHIFDDLEGIQKRPLKSGGLLFREYEFSKGN